MKNGSRHHKYENRHGDVQSDPEVSFCNKSQINRNFFKSIELFFCNYYTVKNYFNIFYKSHA